jgi:hypothetical protein
MRLAVEMAVMNMDGEISAVAVGEDNVKFHGMLRLNEEAADIITILNMCRDKGISFNGLVKSLQTKYTDSTPEEIAESAKAFLEKLWQEGLLIE